MSHLPGWPLLGRMSGCVCLLYVLLVAGAPVAAAPREGVVAMADEMLRANRWVEAAQILRESIRGLERRSDADAELLEQYQLLADAYDHLDQIHPAIDALLHARKLAAEIHGASSGAVKKIDQRIETLRTRPRRPKTAKNTASGTPRLVTVTGTAAGAATSGEPGAAIAIPGSAGTPTDDGSTAVSVSTGAPPGVGSAMLKDAAEAIQRGQFVEARRLVDEAIKTDAKNVDALVLKADLCAKTNDLSAALEASEKAVQLAPDHPAANFLYGSSLFVAQRYDEAARALEHTVSVAPTFNAALLPLGSAYVQTDRYDDALSVFNKAKDVAPNDPKVRTMLGNLLVLMDRPADAVEELNFAVEKDPGNAQSRFYLGLAQLNSGNRPEAEAQLTKLKDLAPDMAEQLQRHLSQK